LGPVPNGTVSTCGLRPNAHV